MRNGRPVRLSASVLSTVLLVPSVSGCITWASQSEALQSRVVTLEHAEADRRRLLHDAEAQVQAMTAQLEQARAQTRNLADLGARLDGIDQQLRELHGAIDEAQRSAHYDGVHVGRGSNGSAAGDRDPAHGDRTAHHRSRAAGWSCARGRPEPDPGCAGRHHRAGSASAAEPRLYPCTGARERAVAACATGCACRRRAARHRAKPRGREPQCDGSAGISAAAQRLSERRYGARRSSGDGRSFGASRTVRSCTTHAAHLDRTTWSNAASAGCKTSAGRGAAHAASRMHGMSADQASDQNGSAAGLGAPADVIAGARVVGQLGVGTLAEVFRGIQPSTGRAVAIKVLKASIASTSQLGRRFGREALLLSRFAHQNIPQVYETGEVNGRPFIVMELIEGPSLHALSSRRSPRCRQKSRRSSVSRSCGRLSTFICVEWCIEISSRPTSLCRFAAR